MPPPKKLCLATLRHLRSIETNMSNTNVKSKKSEDAVEEIEIIINDLVKLMNDYQEETDRRLLEISKLCKEIDV